MRIDKYLKVSRIIKRRTLANEACDKQKVMVNGHIAKASYEIKLGDIIEITFGNSTTKLEVVSVSETSKKEVAKEMYRMLS